MNDHEWLAARFEENRPRLRSVAYRMLGSLSEADDAVQEAWLRMSTADTGDVENVGGWMTTIVARVTLNMLQSRKARREVPFAEHLPDPVIKLEGRAGPEDEAMLADSLGPALLVVLDTLNPAERLAFILHDIFAMPFDEIAHVVDRSPAAARQLASRARRRVQGAVPVPDADVARQRRVVDAFLAAARSGDFDALVAILDPDVVLRSDTPERPGALTVIHGAAAVARQALSGAGPAAAVHPALVNGVAGVVVSRDGRPFAAMAFTVTGGKIAAIDVIADPGRLTRLGLTDLDD